MSDVIHMHEDAWWGVTLCGKPALVDDVRSVLEPITCEKCLYIDRIRGDFAIQKADVDPLWIADQRKKSWPDIHPEDYCHMCGRENPSWYANYEQWMQATKKWAEIIGREGICCPTCFIKMFSEAMAGNWIMKITLERLDKDNGDKSQVDVEKRD